MVEKIMGEGRRLIGLAGCIHPSFAYKRAVKNQLIIFIDIFEHVIIEAKISNGQKCFKRKRKKTRNTFQPDLKYCKYVLAVFPFVLPVLLRSRVYNTCAFIIVNPVI